MKKILYSVMAMAIAALTFASCSDVPEPYPIPGGDDPAGGVAVEPQGDGSQANPYNVAAMFQQTSDLAQGSNLASKVYMKGIITSVKECSAQFGNATFYIGDTSDATKTFYVYRCLGLDNKNVRADDLVQVGDEVVVYGTVTNYNGTIETAQKDAYIVSITRNGEVIGGEPAPQPSTVEPEGTGDERAPFNVAAAIKKCQEAGTTATANQYYVKGIVKSVDESGISGYGNINIDIVDAGSDAVFKAFQIYSIGGQRFTGATGIKAGDEVVVKGNLVNYMNNTPETTGKGAGCLVSVNGKTELGPAPEPGPGPETTGDSDLSLLMKRIYSEVTTGSVDAGTKTSGGLTMTFAKNDGTNGPKYYWNATDAFCSVRMYAKNSVEFSADNTIAKMVITCAAGSGTTYYNGNPTMTTSAGTITKASDNVTVTIDNINAKSFKLTNEHTSTSAGVQFRIVSIAVYYAK